MATQPLSHHEIIGLVAPFARLGRHVDLAASDRLQRRLLFKPAEHAATQALPALRETLQLDDLQQGDSARSGRQAWRLTRLLALPCGAQASLVAEGGDIAELLARVLAVPPQRQVRSAAGATIVLHQRVDAARGAQPGSSADTAGAVSGPLRLLGAQAQVAGMTLTLRVPAVSGIPADVELLPTPAGAADASGPHDLPHDLPQDLLGVLGWRWSRIARIGSQRPGWHGSLRLRRSEPQRSLDAEERLAQAAAHVARTLAEPPGRFHERHRAARWRVSLRRAVPLLVCVALCVGAALLPRLQLAHDSVMLMLIFNAPPLLLLLFFSMNEMPSIELPPLPRRDRAASWQGRPAP